MAPAKLDVFHLLKEIKEQKPIIHHLTNWVTIYDCANIIKVMGASPVMAHSPEEAADMTSLAAALVLNLGTLTVDLVESMKLGRLLQPLHSGEPARIITVAGVSFSLTFVLPGAITSERIKMSNVTELEVVTEEPPQQSAEEPPHRGAPTEYATSRRAAIWADVPDAQWTAWRWQLSHRLNTLEDQSKIIELTEEEIEGLNARNKFRVDITPYFASLIDPRDPDCPGRMQVIPRGRELAAFESMMEDSLAEDGSKIKPSETFGR